MDDAEAMRRAVDIAATVRATTSPNPWVGCVLVTSDGRVFEGATEPPPGRHAERVALDAARTAGAATEGATAFVTLEPCSHTGRTGPCADALVAAGIARAVVSIEDPDANVRGRGVERLRAEGITVDVGIEAAAVRRQLAPYLKHRATGRPFVVLKWAATLDGRTAAPDGTSKWITGPEARADAHRLRAESDAVIVGAGTVRADDPQLTVRDAPGNDPLRVVLGHAPEGARAHPCVEHDGPLVDLLEQLGAKGVMQVLVEGGAQVAADFHRQGLVDRYVAYVAPVLLGGDDGAPTLRGDGARTMRDSWRGRVTNVEQLGADVKIEMEPN